MKTKFIILTTGIILALTAFTQNNKHMKNNDYSVEVIRYSIPAGQSENFEKAYSDAAAYLKASEYCLGYKMLHGDEEPENFILIIHWTSKEDHMGKFRKSAQFPHFFNLVKPFYNNIQEMKHYNVTATEWSR